MVPLRNEPGKILFAETESVSRLAADYQSFLENSDQILECNDFDFRQTESCELILDQAMFLKKSENENSKSNQEFKRSHKSNTDSKGSRESKKELVLISESSDSLNDMGEDQLFDRLIAQCDEEINGYGLEDEEFLFADN